MKLTIPDLPNGLPRVVFDEDGLSVLVTDDMPVYLIVGDERQKLVFETVEGSKPDTAIVRAVPKDPAK